MAQLQRRFYAIITSHRMCLCLKQGVRRIDECVGGAGSCFVCTTVDVYAYAYVRARSCGTANERAGAPGKRRGRTRWGRGSFVLYCLRGCGIECYGAVTLERHGGVRTCAACDVTTTVFTVYVGSIHDCVTWKSSANRDHSTALLLPLTGRWVSRLRSQRQLQLASKLSTFLQTRTFFRSTH